MATDIKERYSSGNLCISGTRFRNKQSTFAERHQMLDATARNEYYPGITKERPSNPDYAALSVRLDSFNSWDSQSLSPNELASAGFYFTGVSDCVRCFFCGTGIKDWQMGDCPKTEHARCSPNCAFLKQSEHQEHCTDDLLVELFSSVASKQIIDMGYSQEDVMYAIRFAREKFTIKYSTDLKSHHLLEYLLDENLSYDSSHAEKNRVSCLETCNNAVMTDVPGKTDANADIMETGTSSCESSKEQHTLIEQNRRLREQRQCKICLNEDACIVLRPCGHLVSCVQCSHALKTCAVCRGNIQEKLRVYQC